MPAVAVDCEIFEALYGEVDDIPVRVDDGEVMLVRPVKWGPDVEEAMVAADGERLCDELCSDLTESGVCDFIEGLSWDERRLPTGGV